MLAGIRQNRDEGLEEFVAVVLNGQNYGCFGWLFPWEFFSLLLKQIIVKHFYTSKQLIQIWWEGWRWCVLVWDCSDPQPLAPFLCQVLLWIYSSVYEWLPFCFCSWVVEASTFTQDSYVLQPKPPFQVSKCKLVQLREESVIFHIQLGKTRRQKNCQEWNNIAWDCIFRWAAPSLFPGLKSNQLELQILL